MAGHRFQISTLVAEPHIWGHRGAGRGTISRRFASLESAVKWWDAQMQLQDAKDVPRKSRPSFTFRDGVNDQHEILLRPSSTLRSLNAIVVQGDSSCTCLADASIDAIVTDPPYYDDLHYDELSLPFRAWAGLSMSRLKGELVPFPGEEGQYQALLRSAFTEMRRILRSNGRLVITFANRNPAAWAHLFEALSHSGFYVHGVASMHSENEGDGVKRNRRTCSHDLVLDLTTRIAAAAEQASVLALPTDALEADFIRRISNIALRQGRDEISNFSQVLATAVAKHGFLRPLAPTDSGR